MKLSIIVPVYNVAPYLRKCVESLLAQDYDDYEIILVDDGSTDRSGAICDEYARVNELENERVRELRRPSFHVIHQPNGGLSAARNAGLKAAKGEYVCFVDSDDYWEENVLGRLMEQVEREKLDVLRFDYQNVRVVDAKHLDAEHIDAMRLEYEVFEPNKTPRYIDRTNEVIDGETYLNTRMSYACYAVQFIVRREIVPDFKEGIYFEDTEWTPRMLLGAKRVNATETVVYNYLTRQGSITKENSKDHIKKKVESLYQVNILLQSLQTRIANKGWINGCIADNVYGILNNIAAFDYTSASYWIGLMCEKNMLPIRGYKVRKMTRLRYCIINFSPRFYCWLRHIRIKYILK